MRQFLFSIPFLIACGTSGGDSTIDLTFDPCAGIALSGGENDLQHAGMADAVQLWADQGVSLSGPSPASIAVEFDDAAPSFRGLYDDERGVIYINRGLVDPTALAVVIAHELGHALGLPHISDRPSVMNPANLTTPPNDADREAVEALWGTCQ